MESSVLQTRFFTKDFVEYHWERSVIAFAVICSWDTALDTLIQKMFPSLSWEGLSQQKRTMVTGTDSGDRDGQWRQGRIVETRGDSGDRDG